jgi:hypothetical protein
MTKKDLYVGETKYTKFSSSLESRVYNYLDKIEGAISGEGGHDQTFKVACVLVHGFGLDVEDAFKFMEVWNEKCEPPWTDHELKHKLTDAEKHTSKEAVDRRGKKRGYLLKQIYSRYAQVLTEAQMAEIDWEHPVIPPRRIIYTDENGVLSSKIEE